MTSCPLDFNALSLTGARIRRDCLLHSTELLKECWHLRVCRDALHEAIIRAHACTTGQGQIITVLLMACLGSGGACHGVPTRWDAIGAGRVGDAGVGREIAICLLAELLAGGDSRMKLLQQLLLHSTVLCRARS